MSEWLLCGSLLCRSGPYKKYFAYGSWKMSCLAGVFEDLQKRASKGPSKTIRLPPYWFTSCLHFKSVIFVFTTVGRVTYKSKLCYIKQKIVVQLSAVVFKHGDLN